LTEYLRRIAFRVATNKSAGKGHFTRCFAVRQRLHCKVSWFVDPGDKAKIGALLANDDDVEEEIDAKSALKLIGSLSRGETTLAVCDSYALKLSSIEEIADRTVLVVDDLNKENSKFLLTICPQPLVVNAANTLFGPQYLAFSLGRSRQLTLNWPQGDERLNCLVSFGAVDSKNLTGLVLESVLKCHELASRLNFICLVGEAFRYRTELMQISNTHSNVFIKEGLESILDLDMPCHVAFGSPGVSHAERLYVGIPTILLQQNNRHCALLDGWTNIGCAIKAQPNHEKIISSIRILLANDGFVAKQISKTGQRVVDGLGADRVARVISKMADEFK